jgi:HAD superfamily hydrolase (TIGR01549 family)
MIKAIIFDCFGVVLSDGFEMAYAKFGGDSVKDHELIVKTMQDASSGKIPSSSPIFSKHLGVSEDDWIKANFEGYAVNEPLLDYAEELKKSYRLSMLSNVGSGGLSRFFEQGLLEKYFDPIVESAAIGYAKPEAAAYEYVADKLGVRLDECVMIDDRPEYIDGAVAIGMKGILYESVPLLKKQLPKILKNN